MASTLHKGWLASWRRSATRSVSDPRTTSERVLRLLAVEMLLWQIFLLKVSRDLSESAVLSSSEAVEARERFLPASYVSELARLSVPFSYAVISMLAWERQWNHLGLAVLLGGLPRWLGGGGHIDLWRRRSVLLSLLGVRGLSLSSWLDEHVPGSVGVRGPQISRGHNN